MIGLLLLFIICIGSRDEMNNNDVYLFTRGVGIVGIL